MKTKSFLLFSISVFAISLFLIIFHSQPPQSFQSIVTQTHQHIKDFQEQLRDVEEQHLVQEERYLRLVGLEGHTEPWHNTTLPALVTNARNDDHALVVAFVLAAARLPYTVLVYNLGLKPYSLAVISNYCNSSKCAIIDFDLQLFPSHVSDESITAYRPLIIQHALSRVGGVIYCEPTQHWVGSAAQLAALWGRVAGERVGVEGSLGVLAWARRAAVTSLTHPRMFHYLHADIDDFLFVQMLDTTRLLAAARPGVVDLMRQWIQCALTPDCIMPIGAQSGGCRFDKKPQYRYSGCHEQDASALSIIMGVRAGYEEARYAAGTGPAGGGRAVGVTRSGAWRRAGRGEARSLLAALRRNATESPAPDAMTARPEVIDEDSKNTDGVVKDTLKFWNSMILYDSIRI